MTTSRSIAGSTALALLVAAGLTAGPAARQAATTDFAAAVKERVAAGRNTGIVAATIDESGAIRTYVAGRAGPGAKPLDADSVFEIGSITKVFTSTILADMVVKGEVSLDDPVAKFLPPSARIPSRDGRAITLIDLATHTSGLPRLPSNFRPKDPQNPYADYTPEQLYDFLSGYTLPRAIGAQFEYSNLGVGLLGHALARRADVTYESLVTSRVLAPLGMTHTGIALTPWMKDHLVRGHDAAGRPVANWDIQTLEGAGALRSTLTDMLLFARASLDPSHTPNLSRALALTHERRRDAVPPASIGLGWLIRPVDGGQVLWHNGGTAGYRTWIGVNAAKGRAAVVLTNSSQGADDLGFDLLK